MLMSENVLEQGIEAEESTGGIVPDVICPACSELINLPLPTYAWYSGQVGCRNCQARVEVKVGDW